VVSGLRFRRTRKRGLEGQACVGVRLVAAGHRGDLYILAFGFWLLACLMGEGIVVETSRSPLDRLSRHWNHRSSSHKHIGMSQPSREVNHDESLSMSKRISYSLELKETSA
jgi:hypothetical protein